MEWVARTLQTNSEHGVSSITTADAHTSTASSRLNWPPPPPADLNGLVRFARKTNSGFCACAITFQLASTNVQDNVLPLLSSWTTSKLEAARTFETLVHTSQSTREKLYNVNRGFIKKTYCHNFHSDYKPCSI
jgi:hypothetical protein